MSNELAKRSYRRSEVWTMFHERPAKARYYFDHPKPQTEAMAFGSLYHAVVLQDRKGYFPMPDTFEGEPWDFRKKAHKEARAAIEAEHVGEIVAKPADWAKAHEMREAVYADVTARRLLEMTPPDKREIKIEWQDDITGLNLHCTLDMIPDLALLADAKSAESADEGDFSRAAFNFGYYFQEAFYSMGFKIVSGEEAWRPMVWVAQEKEPPYLVNSIQLDQDALLLGRTHVRQAIDTLAECIHKDEWPGYGHHIKRVSLPGYAFKTIPVSF